MDASVILKDSIQAERRRLKSWLVNPGMLLTTDHQGASSRTPILLSIL